MNTLTAALGGIRDFSARAFSAAADGARTFGNMVFVRAQGWGSRIFFSRTNIDYARQVGDPMHNSAVVAVVGWIARNFPEAPVRIGHQEPDGTITYIQPGSAGPGYALRLLRRPNKYFSGVLLWMATIVDLYTLGNAYWFKIRNSAGRVVELWWVPAKFMEPRGDETVFIHHYNYNPNGTIYEISPDDVIHYRDGQDPDNPRKGRSKMASLLREIYTDDEAANFSAQLLTNLGVPGVVIAPANTTGQGDARGGIRANPEAVKAKFIETFSQDRRGDPLVLTQPTEVKVLSFSPEQMDLKSLRKVPEERISAVLGIAAAVAGLGAGLDRSTFTNFSEARAAAYEESIIPMHRIVGAELLAQYLDEFADVENDDFTVDFDLTNVRALASYMDAIWKRNESAAGRGLITRADFKRSVNKPVDPDGDDDVYVIAANYVLIDANDGTITRLAAPKPLPAATDPAGEPTNPNVGAVSILPGTRAGEVRCQDPGCNKLLAERAAAPYRMTCPRCKAVTESELEGVAA